MPLHESQSPPKNRSLKWVRALTCTYALFIVALWIFLCQGGDRWWPATLFLFGPRWLFSLPLIFLVPLAAWFERRQLIVLTIAAGIMFIPIMGLSISWPSSSELQTIRVLTCNVGGRRTDVRKLQRLIQKSSADIIALQECRQNLITSIPQGWRLIHEADFLIASCYPITRDNNHNVLKLTRQLPRTYFLQGQIQTPIGELSFTSIHLPSPHPGLAGLLDKRTGLNLSRIKNVKAEMELRRITSREISQFLQTESNPIIIAGDFNMPIESIFYRRDWSDYSNAFSSAGFGYGQTMKAIIRRFEYKIRIDHILMRGPLTAEKCWVASDIGSDHLPLIADIRRTD
jgi:vancomycin resistance protein VanJ